MIENRNWCHTFSAHLSNAHFYAPNFEEVGCALYSWLSLSRLRLSRITAYLEVKIWSLRKHENLTTGIKYCRKEEKYIRRNFSSFPQYFRYISNFKNLITYIYICYMWLVELFFSSILQIWYAEVRISRNISMRPLEFEITRVGCTLLDRNVGFFFCLASFSRFG